MIPEQPAGKEPVPEKSEAEQIDELNRKLNAATREINKLQRELSDAQNELRELRAYKSNTEEKKRQLRYVKEKRLTLGEYVKNKW